MTNTNASPHAPSNAQMRDPAPGDRDLSVYRANAGLVLFNPDGEVFLGLRAGDTSDHPWQFPQGGIDEGEAPLEAAWRELHEETGVTRDNARLIMGLDDWLVYDFPPEVLAAKRAGGRSNLGQKQKWFAFAFTGSPADIRLDAHDEIEFSGYQWAPLERAADMVIFWKRPVYQEVAKRFAHIPAELTGR